MKLNLGCGFNKLEGWVNVDSNCLCLPDIILKLDKDDWLWKSDSIEEVLLDHVLEHVGETTTDFFHFMKELYRVCKKEALITIKVPHPRHDNFMHDCTHVRTITPFTLAMFNKQRNLNDLANNGKESKLGLLLDVDFEVVKWIYNLESKWELMLKNKLISSEQLEDVLKTQNNVCYEILIDLIVRKDNNEQLLDGKKWNCL